jgi:hypothetical protein
VCVFILDCWMERKHEGHGSMRMLTSPNGSRGWYEVVHILWSSFHHGKLERYVLSLSLSFERIDSSPVHRRPSRRSHRSTSAVRCRSTVGVRSVPPFQRLQIELLNRTVTACPKLHFRITFVMRFAALGLGSIGMSSLTAKAQMTKQSFP